MKAKSNPKEAKQANRKSKELSKETRTIAEFTYWLSLYRSVVYEAYYSSLQQ